jgi:mono/diheme cytochrome c family protein
MKMHRVPVHINALLALAVACLPALNTAASGQERRSSNDEPADVIFARVPDKARAKRNPLESDSDAPAAGNKLFEQHCAECHGKKADGAKRGPSLRNNAVQQATPGEIFWILTNGVVRRGMPAWSKLPAEQRWQIITWLKSSQ